MPTIAIVDDDPELRELLADFFGGAGFEVALADMDVLAARSAPAHRQTETTVGGVPLAVAQLLSNCCFKPCLCSI